jgi:ubiquinone/menaquinone biosynthesis C-methylase UbiE
MGRKFEKATRLQRQYYAETAKEYDAAHADEGDNNPRTLRWVYGLLRMIGAESVLDVGSGTGRGVRHLLDNMPGVLVRGIEPVAARIEEAVQNKGIPPGVILQGVGEALPFADASFDVACCFAMLHHVPRPDEVIREMLRVARKGVIIIDGNRFAQGAWPTRMSKLILYKTGLWKIADFLKTGGKGYIVSPGDGVHYSFSIYDSLDLIAAWADELVLIPTETYRATSWFHPLLTAEVVITCALKDTD